MKRTPLPTDCAPPFPVPAGRWARPRQPPSIPVGRAARPLPNYWPHHIELATPQESERQLFLKTALAAAVAVGAYFVGRIVFT